MKTALTRYLALDLAKGIAILVMVCLHYLYVLADLGFIDAVVTTTLPYILISRLVAITFITLSTAVLWYRAQQVILAKDWYISLAKQVFKLSCAALLVTVATSVWLDQSFVRFGILHLLAVTTLVNGLLFRVPLPRWLYGAFGTLLVIVGAWLGLRAYPIVGCEWLGLPSYGFSSVDYVPLLPWLGVAWLSAVAAPSILFIAEVMQPALARNTQLRWLYICGKHSLAIYLLHIPLLLGALWIIDRFF